MALTGARNFLLLRNIFFLRRATEMRKKIARFEFGVFYPHFLFGDDKHRHRRRQATGMDQMEKLNFTMAFALLIVFLL